MFSFKCLETRNGSNELKIAQREVIIKPNDALIIVENMGKGILRSSLCKKQEL